MGRKYIDCRDYPSDSKCSVMISADSEDELLGIAVQHAVTVHGHRDTPEFRQQLQQAIRDEDDAAFHRQPAPATGSEPRAR